MSGTAGQFAKAFRRSGVSVAAQKEETIELDRAMVDGEPNILWTPKLALIYGVAAALVAGAVAVLAEFVA